MTLPNTVLIGALEAQHAAEAAGPEPEDKLRAAMEKVGREHWALRTEDERFTAACEGAARTMEPEDVERLNRELSVLQAFSAAAAGVPVDFAQVLAEAAEDPPKPIGVARLWREVLG